MPASLAADTTPSRDPAVDGRFLLELPDSWSFALPSGGVLMTASLRALALHPAAEGLSPVSATTIFCLPLQAGALTLDARVLRRGSTTLQAEVTARQGGVVGLVTTATFAAERAGPELRAELPALPSPDEADAWTEPSAPHGRRVVPFFEQVEQRVAHGARWWEPEWAAGEARFARWFRYLSPQRAGAHLDPLALPPLADTMPPALRQALGPGAAGFDAPSLDLTVHFLEPTTSDWLLVDARCRAARAGYATADVEVWGEDGRLAARGTQTMFIRRPRR
ncbi:MAG: thioesterase family protein [Polyangiaceae bacterium]|nr:thioesterase family protein [Polyangiaceae bacterium]